METTRLRKSLEDLQVTVTLAGHVRVPADWKHTNHMTANNCIYLFREGEGSLRIRDSAFLPKPGEFFILPAGARISYSTVPDRPFRLMFCHFHAYVGQLPLFQVLDTPLCLRVNDPERAEAVFGRLIERFHEQGALAPLGVKAALFELLGLLWEQEPRKPKPIVSPGQEHWNEILTYIDKRVTEPLTVTEIAEAFSYSPKYFFRLFKTVFGLTPHQYIVKQRMDRAKSLLLTTDWTIARISEELGMERAHFSRMFLGHTDMSPQRFRTWRQGEL